MTSVECKKFHNNILFKVTMEFVLKAFKEFAAYEEKRKSESHAKTVYDELFISLYSINKCNQIILGARNTNE